MKMLIIQNGWQLLTTALATTIQATTIKKMIKALTLVGEANRTAAFKQIGNTVTPLMAEGIAKKTSLKIAKEKEYAQI